jgi:biotin transporter BioY
MVFIIAAFVSGLFIRTVNTQRKALWPTVKVELLSIFILISVTYLYKIGNRIYIYYDGQT